MTGMSLTSGIQACLVMSAIVLQENGMSCSGLCVAVFDPLPSSVKLCLQISLHAGPQYHNAYRNLPCTLRQPLCLEVWRQSEVTRRPYMNECQVSCKKPIQFNCWDNLSSHIICLQEWH